jgi:uncharacterized glyoxalase superfamily protein PhnB
MPVKRRAKAKPGHATRTPVWPTPISYICVKDCAAAIKFYAKAFGAKEIFCLKNPDGSIVHAEIKIGTSALMLASEHPAYGVLSPATLGGSPVRFHLSVKNADAAVKKGVAAGAALERPPSNEFYGERVGTVIDPFGYRWLISHTVERVTPREMQKRLTTLMRG